MTQNYYPKIDQDNCLQCYACISECLEGVLEEKDGTAQVVNPASCIEYCTACKDVCPSDAISYYISEALKSNPGLAAKLKR